jgi:hypothetical protein
VFEAYHVHEGKLLREDAWTRVLNDHLLGLCQPLIRAK